MSGGQYSQGPGVPGPYPAQGGPVPSGAMAQQPAVPDGNMAGSGDGTGPLGPQGPMQGGMQMAQGVMAPQMMQQMGGPQGSGGPDQGMALVAGYPMGDMSGGQQGQQTMPAMYPGGYVLQPMPGLGMQGMQAMVMPGGTSPGSGMQVTGQSGMHPGMQPGVQFVMVQPGMNPGMHPGGGQLVMGQVPGQMQGPMQMGMGGQPGQGGAGGMAVLVPGGGMAGNPNQGGGAPPQQGGGMGNDPSSDTRGGRALQNRSLQPKQGSSWNNSDRRGGRPGPQEMQQMGDGGPGQHPHAQQMGFMPGRPPMNASGGWGGGSPGGKGQPLIPPAHDAHGPGMVGPMGASEPAMSSSGVAPGGMSGQSAGGTVDKKKKQPVNPWADVQDSAQGIDEMKKLWHTPNQQPLDQFNGKQAQPGLLSRNQGDAMGGGKGKKGGGGKGGSWEDTSMASQQQAGGRSQQGKWVEARPDNQMPSKGGQGKGQDRSWVMKENPAPLIPPKSAAAAPVPSSPMQGMFDSHPLKERTSKKKNRGDKVLDDWLLQRFQGAPPPQQDTASLMDESVAGGGDAESDAGRRGKGSRGGKGKNDGGGGGRKDKGKGKGGKKGLWQQRAS